MFPSYDYVLTTDASESGWSNKRFISSVEKTLEIMSQEESQLDWKAYSTILQCKSRRHQPSSEMNHKFSSRMDLFSSHLNHSFAFYNGEDKLIFEEGFYNTDHPNLEISNLVSDDKNTCPSSSSSHVS
ncbi:hypothetical protein ACTFIW_003365 [Dictyostelium discoideum]